MLESTVREFHSQENKVEHNRGQTAFKRLKWNQPLDNTRKTKGLFQNAFKNEQLFITCIKREKSPFAHTFHGQRKTLQRPFDPKSLESKLSLIGLIV